MKISFIFCGRPFLIFGSIFTTIKLVLSAEDSLLEKNEILKPQRSIFDNKDSGQNLRLRGSEGRVGAGRIEIKENGKWTVFCDKSFDKNDANAICRSLGFESGAIEVKEGSHYGNGNWRQFYSKNLSCTGSESNVEQCPKENSPKQNCDIVNQVAGVECKLNYASHCKPGGYLFQYKCYYFHNEKQKSFDEASLECKQNGGSLAVITFKEVNDFLSDAIFALNGSPNNKWYSSGRKTDFKWHWDTGYNLKGRTFTRWKPSIQGSIDNKLNNLCLVLSRNEKLLNERDYYFWDVVPCDSKQNYICEEQPLNVGCGKDDMWPCPNGGSKAICSNKEQMCGDIPTCIPNSYKCDGDRDCPNGNDEAVDCVSCGKRAIMDTLRFDSVIGTQKARIVGGNEAIPGSYPWTASIRIKPDVHHCGAVLINENYVLTAAHCFDKSQDVNKYEVRVGDWDNQVSEGTEQTFAVEKIIRYPNYISVQKDDIAVIKIVPKNGAGVKYTDFIQPICLAPKDAKYNDGTECFVSGWGRTKNTENPRKLQFAELPILSREKCTNPKAYGSTLSTSAFCAGLISGGVDSCVGDSGGPFACENNGLFYLYGIVSWGDGCAERNKPGVYTKVADYVDWIKSTTEK